MVCKYIKKIWQIFKKIFSLKIISSLVGIIAGLTTIIINWKLISKVLLDKELLNKILNLKISVWIILIILVLIVVIYLVKKMYLDKNKLKDDEKIAIQAIIDSAVELCNLKNWNNWTSWTVGLSPQWEKAQVRNIDKFKETVLATIWPPSKKTGIERAAIVFSILIQEAVNTFLEHAELSNDTYREVRFYQEYRRNNIEYSEIEYQNEVAEFDKWQWKCFEKMCDATKAANWFAEEVRKYIDPKFFMNKGRFRLTYAEGIDYKTELLEFTEKEKKQKWKEYKEKVKSI